MIGAQTILSNIVPADFKPLLSCATPSAFRVIEWKKILAHAPTLAKRIATGEGKDDLKAKLKPLVPKGITLSSDGSGFKKASSLKPEDGTAILALYFSQLKSDDGIFLDLRSSCFGLSKEGQILWQPNGLWTRLDPQFRKGMLSIYEGYYSDKPETLREGLKQVGLIKDDFPPARIKEVEDMILGHIGGDTSNQEFKVIHFTESFEKLFRFLTKEKITLPPDFLYLGIYLAGLYLHLEALGGRYDVRRAYAGDF